MNSLLKDIKYKRHFAIHVTSLMTIAKNDEDIKAYALYLNLHSLYKEKSIHNYKGRYKWLEECTGLSQYMFRKYLNILIKKGWAWVDWQGTNLQIASPKKVIKSLTLDQSYYYDDFELQHTKFIKFTNENNITSSYLKTLVIQIAEKRKRFKYTQSMVPTKVESRKLIQVKLVFHEKMASDKTPNFNLYLDEIASLFGYSTRQAASALISTLDKEGYISRRQQFKQLRKVSGDVQLDNKTTVKNGWVFEQVANRLTFLNSRIKLTWWEECINQFQDKLVKAKADRCKGLDKINSVENLSKMKPKHNPLTHSRTKFKDIFYSTETGEILHEACYYKIKCFTIKGYSTKKVYETKFQPLKKGIYKVETVKLDMQKPY